MNPPATFDQRKLLRYGLQGIALGAVATVLVLVFTVRHDTLDKLRAFSPACLPVLFGMVVVAWLCNGARMWLMCRAAGHPLRYRQAIAVSLSTEFGIAATPAGVGGTVIRLSLLRQAGVPVSTAASLIAADAAVDLVFFSLLAPFAVFLLVRDGILRALVSRPQPIDAVYVVGALIAVIALLITLVRTPAFHQTIERALSATGFGRRKRLASRYRRLRSGAGRALLRVRSSLTFLWRERKPALLANLAVASVQWCCRYMLLPVILLSFGIHVNPVPLFLVQGILFALSLLVVAPGGGGSVELLAALILPGVAPAELVGVIVVVWRFFTYHLYIVGGGTVFFWACRQMDRLFPRNLVPQSP